MARTRGNEPPSEAEIPTTFAEIPPPPYSRVTGEAWIAELLSQTQIGIGELKSDVKHLRSSSSDFRADFQVDMDRSCGWISNFGGLIYVWNNRIDDKIVEMTKAIVKIDTKLDDLLRVSPASSPIPKR
jgi:hypothetical protein